MPEKTTYLVAGCRPWNRVEFDAMMHNANEEWYFIDSKDELNADYLDSIKPRYIFFWHWSWIVPATILDAFECVCFHMTDVPYGRGGSPLQNLIARGHKETKLTALRMTNELDAGDVYMKKELSLQGSAQKIFERATQVCAALSRQIADETPTPQPQTGEPTLFARRTPDMSVLPEDGDSKVLYDHIRMLDAEGYPHAYCDHGDFRLIFTDAAIEGDEVTATVRIAKRHPDGGKE